MFTGLIKDIGVIKKIESNTEGKVFTIETKLIDQIDIDDSVSTNGVCLTAFEVSQHSFKAQAIHVTLEKTNLGSLKQSDKVNLELALRPMDRMGGHFVQGHVNGTGKIKSIQKIGKNYNITFEAQKHLHKYIVQEGSIALDGISLTISRVDLTNDKASSFTVSLIPHTYEMTIFHRKKIGDSLNIEVDMMAKYLENFIRYESKENKKDINELLKEWK